MGQTTHFGLWPDTPKDRVGPTWAKGVDHAGLKEIVLSCHYVNPFDPLNITFYYLILT